MISSSVWCGRRAQLNSGERIEMNYYRHLCSEPPRDCNLNRYRSRCIISSIFAKLKKILWIFAYMKTAAPANACFNASFASSSHATEYLLNGGIKYAIYHLKRGKKSFANRTSPQRQLIEERRDWHDRCSRKLS
jgi:hypothetical protein